MKLGNNLYVYPEHGMLDCNTYVIAGNPGMIIDPGNPTFLENLVQGMQQDGIRPQDIGTIMNTHLHIDHCSGNRAFKEVSGAEIVLPRVQKDNYDFVVVDSMKAFGMDSAGFTEDSVLDENQIKIDGAVWEVINAPGHSPDCVCYYNRQDKILICGDVLFRMNTGRVDLPGGNGEQLKESIESLSRLDIEYLLPGHMDFVSGAGDVKANFEYIKGSVFPWL